MESTPTKDNGIDIHLITLSNYVRPKIVENRTNNWVLNGKKNSFYQYIIDRHNGSPTNSSINNSYIDLIYGRGISAKRLDRATENWAKLQSILSDQDIKNIITDFQVFGEASFQVIETKGGGIDSIVHIGKNMVVPSIENEDGEIESYWFSRNWSNTNKYPPVEYPAFKGDTKQAISIYVIRPYKIGKEYFSDPDYLSGLPYCEMEEEIANLNINSIRQGLSAGYIINIPDGKSLTVEEKEEFEKKIKQKLTGSSNASNFILSFNGRDVEVTITPFPVNENIHKQWQFLTEESKQQILTAHRATSPSIVGIISSSGFSNTADEMDTAEKQLVKRVIRPKQQMITEAFEFVLGQYNINLELFFKPLTEEEERPTELNKEYPIAEALIKLGEEMDDSWEVIDDRASKEITLSEKELNTIFQFARTPKSSDPESSVSKQDTSLFKIRYQYAGNPFPEREFCQKVMAANLYYRAEDLNKDQVTTPGMGPGGSNTYNPFLYKGGVNCNHWWQRKIFLKKNNDQISVNQAVKMILELDPEERKDARWEPNPKEVAQAASPSNNNWRV